MDWSQLGFTSGRRTYKGNRLVGGVENSDHLHGTAADFTAPLNVLRRHFPNNPILDEGDHRHVSGLTNVPFFGRRGTVGLVNGVDTTAPQGNAMPNFAAMSQVTGGFDPLAPNPIQAALMPQPAFQQAAQPNFAAMSQPMMGHDPLAPQQGKRKFNGAAILGIIGDALAAYGGQRGVFAPMMAQQRADEADDARFRERLGAEIEMRRQAALAKAAEPPQEFQTADYFNRLPPGAQDAFLRARDAISPIVADIAQPDGSVRRSIIPRGSFGGPRPGTVEEGFVFLGGDPADPSNWRQQ